jgi:NADPH:quinone reductase-like Zn-dependent oxidoreductase
MKLRYKILNSLLLLIGVAIAALAVAVSYDAPCEPAPAVASGEQTMKAVRYYCYGSTDVLEYDDVEKPSPAADEVLIKVQFAAVNPLDWHYLHGTPYFMRLLSGLGTPADSRLGVDLAGTVEAVGSNVTRFKPGDEVFGGGNGAFAEYVIAREDGPRVMKPANVSFEQAATVGIAGVTALQALRDKGRLEPGQKVLINGASGGVGTFAVQIAKSMGAEVTGVCSTRNVEMVRSIGADHVIDYKKDDYTKGDQRYDLIIDMVGNHSLSKNRQVLTPAGALVMVGGATGNWLSALAEPLKALIYSKFVDQQFVMILAELNQEDLVIIGNMIAAGAVTPVVDRRYPLSEIASAIEYSEDGHARGKIIIEVN